MNIYSAILFRENNRIVEEHLLRDIITKSAALPQGEGVFDDYNCEGVGLAAVQADKGHFRKKEDLVFVGDITLSNKGELFQLLNVANKTGEWDDVDIIFQAYKKWGIDCARYLVGDFAFILWDSIEQQYYCVRDQLGQRPLYYFLDEQCFLAANWIPVLSQFSFAADLDRDWIIDFLQWNRSYRDKTVFKNIKQLLPGHYMIVRKGDCIYNRYWNLEDVAERDIALQEATEGLQWHLRNAVESNLDSNSTGIELSGGLDSSAIAAFAADKLKKGGAAFTAFSNALPDEFKGYFFDFTDEVQKARSVSKHVGISKHLLVDHTLDSPVNLLNKTLDITGYPANSFLSLFQQGVYDLAKKENVKTLLSGFGGDEMVSANANARYVHSLMMSGNLTKAYRFFKDQGRGNLKAMAVTGYHYYSFLKNPGIKNYKEKLSKTWQQMILTDEILNDRHVKAHFFDYPLFRPHPSIRQKSLVEINCGYVTERIETCYFVTQHYGIEYKYPMLHTPLLEYYYSIPDAYKAISKNGRGLFRQAIKDVLPPDIVTQNKPYNTATIPYYKIEVDSFFYEIKEYCLSLPDEHFVFEFIDKKKIAGATYTKTIAHNLQYSLFKTVVALSMFIDKRKSLKLYDL